MVTTTSDLKLGVFQSLDKATMLEELLGWENTMVNKTNNNTKARNSNNETDNTHLALFDFV